MAVKNINDLNNQADVLLPDNNQQLISPADIRNAIKDVNDSAVNRLTDSSLLGLKQYDTLRVYQAGEGAFYDGVLYEALEITSGSFNHLHWVARSSSSGTWGGISGSITSQTDLSNALNAKQDALTTNSPLFKSGSILDIQQANATQGGYLSASDWVSFDNKENAISVESPLTRTGNTLAVQYVSDTQDGVLSSQNWMDLKTRSFEITYADALTAVANETLSKGYYYRILTGTRLNEGTGTRGDIILLALENNKFALQGYLVATMPIYELIGDAIVGIWNLDVIAPNIGDKYIYNGVVYNNLTGVSASSPDVDTDNWEFVILTNLSYYKVEIDLIEYDIINDWISYRADKRGNRYTFTRSISLGVYNSIDTFQWGNNFNFGNIIENGTLNNINETAQTKLVNLTGTIILQSSNSVNRTYVLPDSDGTFALLSDLHGGADSLVAVTFDELLGKIEDEALNLGARYLITDFKTIHVISETTSVNTADVEPIICTATSSSTIDSKVLSTMYPLDTLIYDVNDVIAEDGITERPGRIIYRKDNDSNLETSYDFRAVKFRRWKIDGTGMPTWAFSTSYSKGDVVFYSGIIYKALVAHIAAIDFYTDLSSYRWAPIVPTLSEFVAWAPSTTDFGGTIYASTGTYQDHLTFASGCKNITIGKHSTQPYNNIVFLTSTGSCSIGLDSRNMTIFNGSDANKIGQHCQGIILYDSAEYNEISDDCSGVIITNSIKNDVGNNCKQLFISGSSSNNTFENSVENIFLDGSSSGNTFKRNSKYNFLSASASENVIGVSSSGNVLTGSARGNIVGSIASNSLGANNNIIYNGAYANTLSDGCSGNSFSNSSNANRLAENCGGNNFMSAYNNVLDIGCSNNQFNNNSSYNKLGSYSGYNNFIGASYNSIGQACTSNAFNYGCNGNSIGNRCDYNSFGYNSVGNRMGNYCMSNQVLPSTAYYYSASGQYNVFENYCSNNVINGNYNTLENYCHFIQCLSSQVFLSNCFFCSGLQNIQFNGTFIVDQLKVLQAQGFGSLILVTSMTAPKYNNIVVDMKDPYGNLWYRTISLTGKMSTKKFV